MKNILFLSSIMFLLGASSQAIQILNETEEDVKFHLWYIIGRVYGPHYGWVSTKETTNKVAAGGSIGYPIIDIAEEAQDYIKSQADHAQLTAYLRTIISANDKMSGGCYDGANITENSDISLVNQARITFDKNGNCTTN